MAFVLTAQIRLQAPKNTGAIVNQINRQLNTITTTVNVNIAPNSQKQLNNLNQNLNKTNKAIKSTSDGLRGFGEQSALALRRFGGFVAATFAFRAFINSFNEGISSAIDFQRQLVRVSQVTDRTFAGLQNLTGEIKRLSTQFGVQSRELVEASLILAQAGLSAEQTRQALQALAKADLSPTFNDIIKVTEGSIAIFQQFGKEAKDLESVLSSINSVSARFAVESDDIITAVRRTGGAFAAAGGNLNDLIGLFTSVRATTRESAESIATGFRTIFTRLQRTRTINFLGDLGIQLRDLEGQFVGPFEAIRRLSNELNQLRPTDPRFAQITEELGGFRQVSKVIPLVKQFALAEQARAVAIRETNSLSKDAVTAQDAFAVQIQKVREEFAALTRELVDSSGFKTIVRLALSTASAFIKVADSIRPLIPLITALSLPLLARATGTFAAGFASRILPTTRNKGGLIPRFATGGVVPGSGNRDTVPAMLTPGEFVIRKKAVEKIGTDNLARLNKGGVVQKFAGGGQAKRDAELDRERKRLNFSRLNVNNIRGFDDLKDIASRLSPDQDPAKSTKYLNDKYNFTSRRQAFGFLKQLGLVVNQRGRIVNDLNAAPGALTPGASGLGQVRSYRNRIKEVILPSVKAVPGGRTFKEVILGQGSTPAFGGAFFTGGSGTNLFTTGFRASSDLRKSGRPGQPTKDPIGFDKLLTNIAKVTGVQREALDTVSNITLPLELNTLSKESRETFSRTFNPGFNKLINQVTSTMLGSAKGKFLGTGLQRVDTRAIEGQVFEAVVGQASGAAIQSDRATFDFPQGLGNNKLFPSATPGVITDAKRNLDLGADGNVKPNKSGRGKGGDSIAEKVRSVLLNRATNISLANIAGKIQFRAGGGAIDGRDTVPALLTPGEFVVRKSVVDRVGVSNLERLNRADKLPGYASGGLVSVGLPRSKRIGQVSTGQFGGEPGTVDANSSAARISAITDVISKKLGVTKKEANIVSSGINLEGQVENYVLKRDVFQKQFDKKILQPTFNFISNQIKTLSGKNFDVGLEKDKSFRDTLSGFGFEGFLSSISKLKREGKNAPFDFISNKVGFSELSQYVAGGPIDAKYIDSKFRQSSPSVILRKAARAGFFNNKLSEPLLQEAAKVGKKKFADKTNADIALIDKALGLADGGLVPLDLKGVNIGQLSSFGKPGLQQGNFRSGANNRHILSLLNTKFGLDKETSKLAASGLNFSAPVSTHVLDRDKRKGAIDLLARPVFDFMNSKLKDVNIASDSNALRTTSGFLLEGFVSALTNTERGGKGAPFDFTPSSRQAKKISSLFSPAISGGYYDAKLTARPPGTLVQKAVSEGLFDKLINKSVIDGGLKAGKEKLVGIRDKKKASLQQLASGGLVLELRKKILAQAQQKGLSVNKHIKSDNNEFEGQFTGHLLDVRSLSGSTTTPGTESVFLSAISKAVEQQQPYLSLTSPLTETFPGYIDFPTKYGADGKLTEQQYKNFLADIDANTDSNTSSKIRGALDARFPQRSSGFTVPTVQGIIGIHPRGKDLWSEFGVPFYGGSINLQKPEVLQQVNQELSKFVKPELEPRIRGELPQSGLKLSPLQRKVIEKARAAGFLQVTDSIDANYVISNADRRISAVGGALPESMAIIEQSRRGKAFVDVLEDVDGNPNLRTRLPFSTVVPNRLVGSVVKNIAPLDIPPMGLDDPAPLAGFTPNHLRNYIQQITSGINEGVSKIDYRHTRDLNTQLALIKNFGADGFLNKGQKDVMDRTLRETQEQNFQPNSGGAREVRLIRDKIAKARTARDLYKIDGGISSLKRSQVPFDSVFSRLDDPIVLSKISRIIDTQRFEKGGKVLQSERRPLSEDEIAAIYKYILNEKYFNQNFLRLDKGKRNKAGSENITLHPDKIFNRNTNDRLDFQGSTLSRRELVNNAIAAVNTGRGIGSFQLFRGVGTHSLADIRNQIGVDPLSKDAVGKSFRLRGLISAAKTRAAAEVFGRNMINITTKDGARLLDLTRGENEEEQEVLLQHGSKFRINGADKSLRNWELKVQQLNSGGRVPGSGNRDTVPALLTPGEFVLRKKAAQNIGEDNLQKLNKGGVVGYQTGGIVSSIGNAASNPVLLASVVAVVSSFTEQLSRNNETLEKFTSSIRQAAIAFGGLFFVFRQLGQSITQPTIAKANETIASRTEGRKVQIERRRTARQTIKDINAEIASATTPIPQNRLRELSKNHIDATQAIADAKKKSRFDKESIREQEKLIKSTNRASTVLTGLAGVVAGASAAISLFSDASQRALEKAVASGDAERVRDETLRQSGLRGANSGLTLGAGIGGALGLIGGPIGAAVGAAVGSALGGAGGFAVGISQDRGNRVSEEAGNVVRFQPILDNFASTLSRIDREFVTAESQIGNISTSITSISSRLVEASPENRRNLISDINAQLPAIDKAFQSVAKSSTSFEEFNIKLGGVNGQLPNSLLFFSEFSRIPVDELTKRFSDQIEAQNNAIRATNAASAANEFLSQRARNAAVLINSLNDAAISVNLFSSTLGDLSAFASGQSGQLNLGQTSSVFSRVGSIGNLEQFNRIVDDAVGILGPSSQILADEVKLSARIAQDLPQILLNIRDNASLSDEDGIKQTLERTLGDRFSGQSARSINKFIIDRVTSIIGSEGKEGTFLSALSSDFSGTLSQITSGLDEFGKVFAEAISTANTQMSDFAQGLATANENARNLAVSFNKTTQILEQRERFEAGLANRPVNDNFLRGLQNRQISNVSGGRINNIAGANPQAIAGDISSRQQRITQLTEQLNSLNARDLDGRRQLIEEQAKERRAVAELTQSLDFLADAGARTAVAQDQLNRVVEEQSKKFNLISNFTFAGREDRVNQLRTLRGAGAVAQGLSPQALPEQLRGSVQSFLREFADIALPVLGGQTGRQVEQKAIFSELLRAGVPAQQAQEIALIKTTDKQQQLIDEIRAAFGRAESAQNSLNSLLVSSNDKFINGLGDKFDKFISSFERVIAQQEADRLNSSKNNLEAQQQLFKQNQEDIQTLSSTFNAPIDDKESFNVLKNNLTKISEINKSVQSQQKVLSAFNNPSQELGAITPQNLSSVFEQIFAKLNAGGVGGESIGRLRERLTVDNAPKGDPFSVLVGNAESRQKRFAQDINKFINAELRKEATKISEQTSASITESLKDVTPFLQQTRGVGDDPRELLQAVKDVSALTESVKSFKKLESLSQVDFNNLPKAQEENTKAINALTAQISKLGPGIEPVKKNFGGAIPGFGTRDTVPAMLTPGEFVIRAEAARSIGINNLHALNAQGLNKGGPVLKRAIGFYVTGFADKNEERKKAALEKFVKTGISTIQGNKSIDELLEEANRRKETSAIDELNELKRYRTEKQGLPPVVKKDRFAGAINKANQAITGAVSSAFGFASQKADSIKGVLEQAQNTAFANNIDKKFRTRDISQRTFQRLNNVSEASQVSGLSTSDLKTLIAQRKRLENPFEEQTAQIKNVRRRAAIQRRQGSIYGRFNVSNAVLTAARKEIEARQNKKLVAPITSAGPAIAEKPTIVPPSSKPSVRKSAEQVRAEAQKRKQEKIASGQLSGLSIAEKVRRQVAQAKAKRLAGGQRLIGGEEQDIVGKNFRDFGLKVPEFRREFGDNLTPDLVQSLPSSTSQPRLAATPKLQGQLAVPFTDLERVKQGDRTQFIGRSAQVIEQGIAKSEAELRARTGFGRIGERARAADAEAIKARQQSFADKLNFLKSSDVSTTDDGLTRRNNIIRDVTSRIPQFNRTPEQSQFLALAEQRRVANVKGDASFEGSEAKKLTALLIKILQQQNRQGFNTGGNVGSTNRGGGGGLKFDVESIQALSTAFTTFSSAADKLAKSVEVLNGLQVQHQIGGTVEIIMNGGEVLNQLQGPLQDLINAKIVDGINKMLAEKFPNAGNYRG